MDGVCDHRDKVPLGDDDCEKERDMVEGTVIDDDVDGTGDPVGVGRRDAVREAASVGDGLNVAVAGGEIVMLDDVEKEAVYVGVGGVDRDGEALTVVEVVAERENDRVGVGAGVKL